MSDQNCMRDRQNHHGMDSYTSKERDHEKTRCGSHDYKSVAEELRGPPNTLAVRGIKPPPVVSK